MNCSKHFHKSPSCYYIHKWYLSDCITLQVNKDVESLVSLSLWWYSSSRARVGTCTGVPRKAYCFSFSWALPGCFYTVWMFTATAFGPWVTGVNVFLRERRRESVSNSVLCMCVLVCFFVCFECVCGIWCHPEVIAPPAPCNPLIKTTELHTAINKTQALLWYCHRNFIKSYPLLFIWAHTHKSNPISLIVSEADLGGFSWCNYHVIVLIWSVVFGMWDCSKNMNLVLRFIFNGSTFVAEVLIWRQLQCSVCAFRLQGGETGRAAGLEEFPCWKFPLFTITPVILNTSLG